MSPWPGHSPDGLRMSVLTPEIPGGPRDAGSGVLAWWEVVTEVPGPGDLDRSVGWRLDPGRTHRAGSSGRSKAGMAASGCGECAPPEAPARRICLRVRQRLSRRFARRYGAPRASVWGETQHGCRTHVLGTDYRNVKTCNRSGLRVILGPALRAPVLQDGPVLLRFGPAGMAR